MWAVLFDLSVLTCWQVVDPPRWVELKHGPQVTSQSADRGCRGEDVTLLLWLQPDPADPDVLVQLLWQQCSSADAQMWLSGVLAYKGPLLVGVLVTAGLFCCSLRFSPRGWAAGWPGGWGGAADASPWPCCP